MEAALLELLRCPRCKSGLDWTGRSPRCADAACALHSHDFPIVAGQPVLIDFERSIFERGDYNDRTGGSVLPRATNKFSFKRAIKHALLTRNEIAASTAPKMVALAAGRTPKPRILVIGGGAIGSGAEALYDNASVELIGTDVYASSNTGLVCDAHQLPFPDASMDAVWIQAVLEHVLSPHIAVAEIERVLKPGGLVYADTPFMQQVHEKAYDFTRFSLSGQRWLFRNFEQIDAGAVGGAGTALISSIRYFARAISSSDKLATLASLPFFWLRFFDRMARKRPNIDAASGTFFYGRKSDSALRPSQMVAYYEGQAEEQGSA